uniref:GLTSCR protein conserved domain-containing protein n=1 Tax=Timema poppense TaxID=170557 RepID=A0A7R9GYV6_TIMPO|nr:unnamed protein product [Timema poppensis]
MTMYDPEEQTNQSQQQQQQQQQQVIPGGSPGSAGQTQDQQSQLLTQLHTQGGGQPSFKLALEDGKVIFQPDSRGVNSGTSNSTSLLLQNMISSQTQSGAQQSMAAAHSQLTALLGNSSSNQQHVVLSQLLQQSCPSSLPQLVSTGTNTTSQACGSPGSVGGPTGSFNHSLEQTNKTVSPTLTRDAFTEIQPGSKTVVTSSSSRNSFSNLAHGQQHVSGKYLDRMSISLGSGPNAPALLMNRDISNVTSSGLHGATHTPISMMVGENNASGSSGMTLHNSTKTVVANNNAAIQNLGNSSNLLMNSDSSPNLVLSRNSSMSNVPSHSAQANAPIVVSVNSSRSPTNSLRGCGSGESVKVVSPATSCLDSSTNNKCSGPGPVAFVHPLHHCERPVVGNSMTQTENLIEPSPLQQSKINDSFFPPTSLTHAPKTTVSNTDTSQAFFNLQSFPGLAPSGGTMPLMAACSTTGSGGYTGAEQLVIAHPGGLSSVVATPQLLQCLQQAQGLNMQLTPNMLNKALSGASFTFSSGGGTILIGGDSYNSPVMAGQTKMTSPLNNTKTTLQQQPPQSVLLQQLNTGVRRCSSDSNSSLSLGSPPPVVNQHQSPQILNHHRKGHQSIETQTVSTNPSFPNTFLDSIVQSHPSLVVNKLGNKQILNIGPVRKPKKPKKNDRNSIKVTPSMNVMPAGLVNSANMQNLQQRVCPNQIMVDPIKTNLHDRLFTKSTNLNSQNIMMGSVSTAGDLPCSTSPSFFATSQPYTTAPSRTVLVTSTVNSTVGSCQNPPLNVLCHNSSGHLHTKGTTGSSSQFGRSVATQSHTNVPTEPSLGHVVISSPSASLALGNSIVTTTASLSTKVSVTNSILTSSQPHACASNTVNCSPGGVPHLVPFPPSSLGGPSAAPGTTQSGGQVLAPGSIIQKVQTIQLTPQNQKNAVVLTEHVSGLFACLQHLKAVQLQIESLQNKKQLTPGDSAALQRLYDEQKRILATGKVVPTIPGQHAQGLHFNPPALDGDNDIYSNRHSTYLADLLRHQVSHQSNVSSHHQQQQQLQPQGPAVRYHHQVGNQVIPFPPPNHHHKNSTSSITPTTASHTGYRITPAVVQCHGTQTGVGECHQTSMALLHVDSSSQASLGTQGDKEVELVPVPVPKMSVTVSPIPPPPNKCHSPVVMCEKGTSPIQVQVGTQTALPCEVSPRHKLVPCLPAVDVKPPLSPQVNKTASVPVCVNNSATINSGGCNSSVSTSTTSTVKLAPHLNKPQLTGLAPASPSARAAKSPLRPTISRCDLIEQQLKTDKAGAHAPDTSMPFRDRGDACKRLVRYHVYNEQQVLSQQDLEKADEIFEATAKHLLDKFRQMMNKYRYLLHMESMREVNTSELIMIDRMFVAEEHNILERLKQDTVKVKEEPSTVTVKMEPGTDLREVRVVVQDVMKNQSIKRELEEDHKVTVTAVGSSKRSRHENDEWLEVQRETGRSDIKTEGSGGCAGDSSVLAEDSRQRTSVGPLGQGGTGRDRPRDEGGGEPKRKEGCDSSEPVVTPHRKKRHKPSDGTDDGEGCDDDELNAQVQSAIDSILNLQRSEDGFELPSSLGAATEHAPTGISQDMDGEDTQQFMSPQDEHLLNNGVGDSPEALVVEFSGTGVGEDSGASSDNPDDDPALDEAVRSILTS